MDAWEALKSISRLDMKIRHLERQYDRAVSDMTSIQAVRFDRVSVSGGGMQTDTRIEELAIKSKELSELKSFRAARMKLIEGVTDQMDDDAWVEVLLLSHVDGLTCDEIGKELNFSRSHTYRILRNAECQYRKLGNMRQNETE